MDVNMKKSEIIQLISSLMIITFVTGFFWGYDIQTYRSQFRRVGTGKFFLAEIFMIIVFAILLYLQRQDFFGNRFSIRKLIVFEVVLGIITIHIINILSHI